MATKSGVIVVGDEAVNLLELGGVTSKMGTTWTGYNSDDTVVIWCGDKNVQIGQGIPIQPGGIATKVLGLDDTHYGIAEADVELNVMMDGV